jgi:hypothetical protein
MCADGKPVAAVAVDSRVQYVSDVTSGIHRAVCFLHTVATSASNLRSSFDRDVVAHMLDDLWADVMLVRRCVQCRPRACVCARVRADVLTPGLVRRCRAARSVS